MKEAVSYEAPTIDFATLDLLPYGIIVLDKSGTVLYYNRREEAIANRDRADVVGRNFFTEVAPCTQLTEFSERFEGTLEAEGLTAEFAFHFPFRPVPRDVQVALTSFRYEGKLLCLVSVRDLTEEQDVRDRIRAGERFSEIGEVAAGVAHNFNNILMAIGLWGQTLARQNAPDSKPGIAARHILNAVADGTRMVERIRQGVRQATSTEMLAPVDLEATIRSAVALVAERKVTITEELETPFPQLRGNASELQEVFVNLLGNAIDATRGGGTVSIRARVTGELVCVDVSDTGMGMSEDVQNKLFRPLFTTKSKGTGLGLSTSYAIVRRHGGEIRVRTAPGSGSTFSVTLPIPD